MKTTGSLIALILAMSITGSVHAVSPDGSWFLQRFNTAGTFFAVMKPHANHFCYLTQVSIEETDSGNEEATCRIRKSGTVWLLEATLDKNGNADVKCGAVCYNN